MVQTSLAARLFGVRLLTLEGTVLLSPMPGAQVLTVRDAATSQQTAAPRVCLPAGTTTTDVPGSTAVGGRLPQAAALLAESDRLLDEPGRAAP